MKDALSFISSMLIAFGVIFEIPLLIFFLAISGIVSISSLVKFQKYMVVIMLTIAAILTPPDVITQLMMGIPMILLYELGLLAAWLFARKKS
jgi:sec-independent protein translocase protein TatC